LLTTSRKQTKIIRQASFNMGDVCFLSSYDMFLLTHVLPVSFFLYGRFLLTFLCMLFDSAIGHEHCKSRSRIYYGRPQVSWKGICTHTHTHTHTNTHARHVTHVNGSWHSCEWDALTIWWRHVTRANWPCHNMYMRMNLCKYAIVMTDRHDS